jgi:rubrerythrin
MDVKTLQHHLSALATLTETGAPVVSCYLNLEQGPLSYRRALDARVELLRRSLPEPRRSQVAAAMEPIEAWLRALPPNGTQGVALFSRAGNRPFFLPLAFRVPLPTWISVDSTPNIYHLVEIKDNYDRYVVLFANEDSARILGINLGAITEDIWKSRPELRIHVGNEWTKEHFQAHRRERGKQFLREQIRIADQLMSAGGYVHLIVAGSARMTAEIRQALPKHMKAKLVDVVAAHANDCISEVVAATVQSFLDHEETESLEVVEQLLKQIHLHGLAVAGTDPCMLALRVGQADILVMAKDYESGTAWVCPACGSVGTQAHAPDACPRCASVPVRQFDIKEEMVRLAQQTDCPVEVVEHSDALMQLGGVGCLLRYAAPENYAEKAA